MWLSERMNRWPWWIQAAVILILIAWPLTVVLFVMFETAPSPYQRGLFVPVAFGVASTVGTPVYLWRANRRRDADPN